MTRTTNSRTGGTPAATGSVSPITRTLAETLRRAEQLAENARIGEDAESEYPSSVILSLETMIERCVLILTGLQVAVLPDKETGDGRRLVVRPLNEFDAEYRSSGERLPDRPRTHFTKQWFEHRHRKVFPDYTVGLGRKRICDDLNGQRVLNIWTPRKRRKPKNPEAAGVFLKHLEYLIPVEKEREKFLDWLAHCEQKPEILPHHGYLMYTRSFGIGRNWMASVLYRVWRGEVASVDLMHMIEKGFNGSISGKRLAVVDEAYVAGGGKSRYAVESDLRRTMTSETRLINPKYGREHEEWNSVRWLLFSNHPDAIPLPKHDRRFTVIANPTIVQPKDYFQRLYGMVNDEDFTDAVGWMLAKRDISKFNPGALPDDNEAKRAVVAATTPEVDTDLADVLRDWESNVAVLTDVAKALGMTDEHTVKSPLLSNAMRRLGAVRDPRKFVISLPGAAHQERGYVWVLPDRATPEDVPAAVREYRTTLWFKQMAGDAKF